MAFGSVDFCKAQFNILDEKTSVSDEYSYWKALCKYWQKDDLIIIEQDIVASPEFIAELINCECKDCAFKYKIYTPTTKENQPIWAYGLFDRDGTWIRLESGDYETAQFTGLGFIKISKESQLKFNLQENPTTFRQNLDMVICKGIKTYFHMHHEVDHLHRN